jgi:hypothetical protein
MRRDKPNGASRLAALALMAVLSFPAIAQSEQRLPEQRLPEQRLPERALPERGLPQDRATLARACLVAAAEAEARLGLPAGVLAAVALTESAAHPFAIGTTTQSHYPASRQAAERLVRTAGAGASGGCFQINVAVHAPRNLSWVFDPWASALFAGRKLTGHLAATEGNWGAALARYLGARPGTEAARLYQCRVAASLAGIGHPPPPGLGTAACRGGEARTAHAKARTLLATANGPAALAALP